MAWIRPMTKNIVYADSQTFQTTIESNTLVFVDFYADWCGPCKMIAPSIERLAEEYNGTVKFVKLNIDENPHIAREHNVKSIPTLMIFRNGKPFRRMIGASPIGHYRGELQKVVSKTQIGKENIGKV
jgi:thioredoxin 1